MYQRSIDERDWEAITEKAMLKVVKAKYGSMDTAVVREMQTGLDCYHMRLGVYTYRWVPVA